MGEACGMWGQVWANCRNPWIRYHKQFMGRPPNGDQLAGSASFFKCLLRVLSATLPASSRLSSSPSLPTSHAAHDSTLDGVREK